MKKLAACTLFLVYFTVTTGFMVSVHYCMGKLSSVELGYTGKTECGKCGMNLQKSHGCCKDDVKLVKMQVDHNFAKTITPDFSLALSASNAFNDYGVWPQNLISADHPFAHGPPLNKQDTYLRNRVFRL
ncbi:HYC_CC_PP family protein [Flavisolibacter ginsenosidimutans]|uniref:Uncharacterized protein n=1 Tax=Flavisolibacter ginsenosidimutans TaxID=661481 RepID=A0A5B8UN95_9BACT|nr:hypothetical protein [Flavisolibacter ginsenosidimutans]QEC58141.1 hypothetical protein FSB75_20265 [Flavisolibacter ginsenosidimutans]